MTADDEKRVAEIAARAAGKEQLRLLLIEVQYKGYAVVPTRVLMGMIGKSNDKPARWREIADAWVAATGRGRNELRGVYWEHTVLLHTEESVGVAENWGHEGMLSQAA